MAHLTQKAVDAALYTRKGNAAHVLWDDDLKGFGLQSTRAAASPICSATVTRTAPSAPRRSAMQPQCG